MRSFLLLFAVVLFSQVNYSQTGSPDLTFGVGGMAKTNFAPQVGIYFNRGQKVIQKQDGFYYVLLEMEGQSTLQRYSANGTLDLSFAKEGHATFVDHVSKDAVEQSDGKIVTAGKAYTTNGWAFALARYNADGSLDQSFGSGGKVITLFLGTDNVSNAEAFSVAVQSDGKILVAGQAYSSNFSGQVFALARYNTNGSLDASFGSGGKVLTAFPYGSPSVTNAAAHAVKVQSDGKIVTAGKAYTTNGWAFALARYNTNGSLDASFGSGGKTITASGNAYANAIAIQADGKIVAAGTAYFYQCINEDDEGYCIDAWSGQAFALARYNTNGTLDTSFGSSGKVFTPFFPLIWEKDRNAVATSIGIQTNGKIVVAGTTDNDQYIWYDEFIVDRSFALARYNSDGTLDQNFGTGGKITTEFAQNQDDYATASSVTIQNNGQIIAVGNVHNFESVTGDTYVILNTQNCALARYNADGSLDQSFGSGGKLLSMGKFGSTSYLSAVQQSDGKIIAVGKALTGINYTESISGTDFILARYHVNGTLDQSFGSGGKVVTTFTSDAVAAANAVIIQKDGKIIAAGKAGYGEFGYKTPETDFALARYNQDGSLDQSFGTGGRVITPFPYADLGSITDIRSLSLQSDGKIVAAGLLYKDEYYGGEGSFALLRYNQDGSLDQSFGSGGSVKQDGFSINSLSLQADGKILAAGDGVLFRYLSNGTLDQTFGSSGKITYTGVSFKSLNLQSDGKITAAGKLENESSSSLTLVRYNQNGTLDGSFGTNGSITTPITSSINNIIFTTNRIYSLGQVRENFGYSASMTAFQFSSLLNSLKTSALSSNMYCPGSSLQIPYTATGNYYTGNVFTAQLSSASGSFTNAVSIGSVTAYGSGVINATIPANTPLGTGYRIRVVSSSPRVTGTNNGSNIAINAPSTYYLDWDKDGYGKLSAPITVCSSTPPAGYVSNSLDCHDGNAALNPNTKWYLDADNDGYYTGTAVVQCKSPGTGYKYTGLKGGSDCNDGDATVSTPVTYYLDWDGDGYGKASSPITVCSSTPPAGYVSNSLDCHDGNAARHPGATEVCNGVDDDCDGLVDEGCNLNTVTSLTLINTSTSQEISSLTNGAVIDLATISGRAINIRANTNPVQVGSVVMNLSGQLMRNQTESVAPYALFGDNGKGLYYPWEPALGSYTLKVTPYTGSSGSGTAGTPLTISFTVVDNAANVLPTANAGADQSITLPTNQLTLSGSGTDPDGFIAQYTWTQLSGPAAATFSSMSLAQPTVSGLVAGTYVFGLRVTDNRGGVSTVDYVSIVVNPALPTLSGLTLVNATTDKDIGPLQDGAVIDLSVTPGINIRANPLAGLNVASVRFGVNSTPTFRMESVAPFAIAGDNSYGDYYPWPVEPGVYTITATPYSAKSGGGTAGIPISVTVTIRRSVAMLSGLTLMKGGTTQEIGPLVDGAVIDLGVTPNINVRATPLAGVSVGSVRFGVNSTTTYRMESVAPFALAGDNSGIYYNWPVEPGVYTITATPYTLKSGGGIDGTPVSVTITIRKAASALTTIKANEKSNGEVEAKPWHLRAYPNPVVQQGWAEFRLPESTQAQVTLVDITGRTVQEVFNGKAEAGVLYKKELRMQGLARGVYFVRLLTGKGKMMTYQLVYQ